jgi:hypothetical protein
MTRLWWPTRLPPQNNGLKLIGYGGIEGAGDVHPEDHGHLIVVVGRRKVVPRAARRDVRRVAPVPARERGREAHVLYNVLYNTICDITCRNM